MRKLLQILSMAIAITLSYPVLAEDFDWNKLERDFRAMVKSDSFIESALDRYHAQGRFRIILREHFVEQYSNEAVIDLAIREIVAYVKRIDAKSYKKGDAFKYGLTMSQDYAIKGIARLEDDEQRWITGYLVRLLSQMNNLNPNDCKKFLTGSLASSEDALIEFRYLEKMPSEIIREYLRLVRKAFVAEAIDYPMRKVLSSEQLTMMQNALFGVYKKRIELGEVSAEDLSVISNFGNASSREACAAGINLYQTALMVDGYSGKLVIRGLLSSAQ